MALGLIGEKCGMTRLYNELGVAVAVSVIQIKDNRIVQVKSEETDGYSAVQVASGFKKRSGLTKAAAGHFAQAGVEAGTKLAEFRVSPVSISDYAKGSSLSVDMFTEGQYVDVRGFTHGKGFAGVIKRYNFRTQDATHGNSLSHRAPGSIGQNQTPGRVFKGKKMAGHLGAEFQTTQNLKIEKVDSKRSLLFIRGAVPGPKGGHVIIRPAIKRT